MLANAVTPDGYYVNSSGQWVENPLLSGNGISYEVNGNLWIKMYDLETGEVLEETEEQLK